MNSENFGSPKVVVFYAAAAGGDMARARELIADGADPDSRNAREMSLLGVAIKEGNRTAFDNLLELGASPSHLGQARDTPMPTMPNASAPTISPPAIMFVGPTFLCENAPLLRLKFQR